MLFGHFKLVGEVGGKPAEAAQRSAVRPELHYNAAEAVKWVKGQWGCIV